MTIAIFILILLDVLILAVALRQFSQVQLQRNKKQLNRDYAFKSK